MPKSKAEHVGISSETGGYIIYEDMDIWMFSAMWVRINLNED